MQEKDSDVRLLIQTADSFQNHKFKTSYISGFIKTQIFIKGSDNLLKLTVWTSCSMLYILPRSKNKKSPFCDSADLLIF